MNQNNQSTEKSVEIFKNERVSIAVLYKDGKHSIYATFTNVLDAHNRAACGGCPGDWFQQNIPEAYRALTEHMIKSSKLSQKEGV